MHWRENPFFLCLSLLDPISENFVIFLTYYGEATCADAPAGEAARGGAARPLPGDHALGADAAVGGLLVADLPAQRRGPVGLAADLPPQPQKLEN